MSRCAASRGGSRIPALRGMTTAVIAAGESQRSSVDITPAPEVVTSGDARERAVGGEDARSGGLWIV